MRTEWFLRRRAPGLICHQGIIKHLPQVFTHPPPTIFEKICFILQTLMKAFKTSAPPSRNGDFLWMNCEPLTFDLWQWLLLTNNFIWVSPFYLSQKLSWFNCFIIVLLRACRVVWNAVHSYLKEYKLLNLSLFIHFVVSNHYVI